MAASFAIQQPAPLETYHMTLPQQPTTAPGDIKRKRFKLEPIKVLEPSSKKLTIPESQRIMYILDELIRKSEIIDYIGLIVNNEEKIRAILKANLNEEERKNKFDQVFLHMCKYHRDLVQKYDRGEFVEDELEDEENDTALGRPKSAQTRSTIEAMIKHSCKEILRVFHLKPSLYDNIKNELSRLKPENKKVSEILGLFREVRDLMHERLLTTPVEQREKIEYIKELLMREKTNNELIKKLKDELNLAMASKEKEIQVRNDQIRKLDSDIKNVERFGADLVKRTKLDAEQQEASEVKASDGRKAKLQQELNQLRQQFQNLVIDHRENEQQLRKEKWKHETNVETLINRYDDEMTKKQDELDEVTKFYDEESKQLKDLEEKFTPLKEEYLKIMDERRTIEHIRRLEEENLNKKIKAAVVIQSYWRGFKLRKGLFKKKKGKGKAKK